MMIRLIAKSAIVFGSSGSEAILITKEDELYALGTNSCSCLGTNRSQGTLEPSRIDTLSGRAIVSLAFGSGPHVLALSQNGEVFSWGHNAFGQLGIGSTTVGIAPSLVGDALSGHNVVHIACGSHHSVAVTDRGEVFSWGRNSCGQVGIGSNVNQDLPRQVTGQLLNRFVRYVVCGQNSTMALTDGGEVFAWGFNGNGQLGAGNLSNQYSPARVIGLHNVVIEQIACGFAHSLALTDEGQLFAWGSNTCGQLCANLPRTNQTSPVSVASALGRVIEVAAIHACNITVAVNQSGKVYMWGQVRGQTANSPVETQFGCIDDAFACFASPAVACRPIQFEAGRRSTILDAIRVAFDDPTTGDVKISVDGHLIHAHKALLRLRCDYFRSRFREHWQDDNEWVIEVAAIHACNITVAVNQSGKVYMWGQVGGQSSYLQVYMWGQVRGQTANSPVETQFGCIDDAFACFASPAVACRPIQFEAGRRSTILDAIRVAFDDPTTGDVKISVDGHLIHAHKALLRLRCDYFRSRFREHWQDDNECAVVEVPHYSYAVYRSFIRWLYTDELHIDIDDAVGLLDLSNCYCENELKHRCSEFIKKGISIENAATFYAAALRFEVKDLEEFCFQFCLNHMTAVTQTEAFARMDDSAVKQFVLQAARSGAFKN
ncbi:RCC1 and BTB domain-containing protein 1 [Toxocara canis]|uniref:RCC1 and BTB domain-containing protein 1 n=1 Tax=Toxocara canis TaxID=6265 RepID=A0A0B2VX73_TOXCA|nr:RCC1 and BTB domain-containing protein 1 [Toxocara canis]